MNPKYLVLKSTEIQKYLNPDQVDHLLAIQQTINAGRELDNQAKPGSVTPDVFFVLNMKDQYAQSAIEAYIAAIDEDTINGVQPNVREAKRAADNTRLAGMGRCQQRLPT